MKAITNKTESIKEVNDFVEERLSLEAKGLIEEIKIIQKDVDYRKLRIAGGNKNTYDFSDYKTFKELFRDLYYRNMTIDEAERKQNEFHGVLGALSEYSAKERMYTKTKNKLLNNKNNFYKGREKIIEGFKNRIFSFHHDDEDSIFEDNDENDIRDNNGLIDYKKLERLINIKERDINEELVRKHFLVQDLGALLEKFNKLKNNAKRNKIQVGLINSGLRDLKEEIEDIREQEKETANPNEIVDIVEKILEFDKQHQGQGLKILTPNQILSRLPISLAQLKAGNNSEKLKKEIKQLLYSLYRSKKLTKNIYKSLTDII